MTILSATVMLLLVMDPIGNTPAFLSILKDIPESRRNAILIRELFFALAILSLFLFSGRSILAYLQITEPAISIAGGILLFLIAIKMIFPTGEGLFGETPGGEPLLVPLATPLIAGPSAIAIVLLLVAREPNRLPEWAAAVLLAWLITASVLVCSGFLSRFLGERGLLALQRLMGMILTVLSVQMFLTGLDGYLDTHPAMSSFAYPPNSFRVVCGEIPFM